MNKPILFNFLEHLSLQNQPFVLRNNGKPPEWDDEALHQQAYNYNPELYALFSVIETVTPEQHLRILFQLLKASRKGFSHNFRLTLENTTNFLLTILHPDKVLTVFLALKRVRANHKHTTRAILKYIFEHPECFDMAICRRPAVVDCLEHALGKNVARACAKIVSLGGDETYLSQNLLRFINDKQRVKSILQLLYRHETFQNGSGEYVKVHQKYTAILESQHKRPKTVTATNRGDISATLVHLYRGGKSEQLMEAVENYVKEAAAKLPRFDGTLALVFDASASTKSYGDRQYCCLAQSVALKLVLEQCCSKVKVYQVGGTVDRLPMPEGYTDIATSLLDAANGKPDLIAIVSDGYENLYPGDLSRVVATLPQIGIETPIVFAQGQKLMFEDACCVQSGQGGFLEEREQWFFILPLFLREEALKLQGQKSYSKLWNAISKLNQRFGLQNRGHLEQILSRKRAFLTQFQSRFELLQGQTGALFILGDKLAGIEIAPNAVYFQEVWMSLVCFCYGVAAMHFEKHELPHQVVPFSATNLPELRQQLVESRQQMYAEVQSNLANTPSEQFEVTKKEKFLDLQLKTIEGKNFAGEFVEEEGNLIYASVFAKSEYALSV